jgi:23S rRNA G2445 N2-methylase RlmL
MPKQRDAATLRESIRSSGFTPGTRDVDGLVELLGDEDEVVVRDAERALTRPGTGPTLVPRLLAKLEGASPRARALGFRVVGRLAPTDAEAARALIVALADGDARVQRGAAHALGRLHESEGKSEIAAALLGAWDDAPELPLAKAIAEALGKLGVVAARDRLESVRDGDAELARIAAKALAMLGRDASRGEESTINGERAAELDVNVVFFCRPGLEAIVESEVRERCPSARSIRRGPPGSGRVMAVWRGAPSALFAVRTMLTFSFALPPEPLANAADEADACVRALTSDTARRILEAWTTGAVRYRLDWRGEGHGRAATWRVVHAVAEHAGARAWINDPTASTWQFSLSVAEGALHVLLTPRKLPDPRFVYRIRDVPAASHPTVAAALVRASRLTADDVVWDPFVGSGSELVERARAAPYRALIGSDLDSEALAAARTNIDAAGIQDVTLAHGDATLYTPSGVTRIVTNPPMGRRVARDGSLAELLDRFTDHAAKVLAPGGRLTWLSPLAGRTAARAESNGLHVVLRETVDMGGFHAELQAWEKL